MAYVSTKMHVFNHKCKIFHSPVQSLSITEGNRIFPCIKILVDLINKFEHGVALITQMIICLLQNIRPVNKCLALHLGFEITAKRLKTTISKYR